LDEFTVTLYDENHSRVCYYDCNNEYPYKSTIINVKDHLAARYVHIQIFSSYTTYLQLAEVKVFYNSTMNGYAYQSSTYDNKGASLAIDGNTDGSYTSGSVSHTKSEQNPWLQIDYTGGSTFDFGEIVLHNRTDCCQERLLNFEITILDYYSDVVWTKTYNLTTAFNRYYIHDAMGVSGYSLKITLLGYDCLHLAEVQIFEAINLALDKTAVQSSTAYDRPASLAIDGNTNGDFNAGSVTHTSTDKNAYLQIDLGAPIYVTGVEIWNRTDACSERLSNFTIYIQSESAAGFYWQTVADYPVISKRYDIAAASKGRYVLIWLNDVNCLHLAEVKIFGSSYK